MVYIEENIPKRTVFVKVFDQYTKKYKILMAYSSSQYSTRLTDNVLMILDGDSGQIYYQVVNNYIYYVVTDDDTMSSYIDEY